MFSLFGFLVLLVKWSMRMCATLGDVEYVYVFYIGMHSYKKHWYAYYKKYWYAYYKKHWYAYL